VLVDRANRISNEHATMSLVQVLPLAIVMIAGPQILAHLPRHEREVAGKPDSVRLRCGPSISLVVVVAYLLGNSLGGGGGLLGASAKQLLHVVVLVLPLRGSGYLPEAEYGGATGVDGELTTATPRLSFRLGFLLLGFFPTDIVTSMSVGTTAANGNPVTDAAGFVLLTLFILALPSLGVFVLGERAEATLPEIRDWMNDNLVDHLRSG